MKKDTEDLDILLLLKSQPLHRVAPFSVPSKIPDRILIVSDCGLESVADAKTNA